MNFLLNHSTQNEGASPDSIGIPAKREIVDSGVNTDGSQANFNKSFSAQLGSIQEKGQPIADINLIGGNLLPDELAAKGDSPLAVNGNSSTVDAPVSGSSVGKLDGIGLEGFAKKFLTDKIDSEDSSKSASDQSGQIGPQKGLNNSAETYPREQLIGEVKFNQQLLENNLSVELERKLVDESIDPAIPISEMIQIDDVPIKPEKPIMRDNGIPNVANAIEIDREFNSAQSTMIESQLIGSHLNGKEPALDVSSSGLVKSVGLQDKVLKRGPISLAGHTPTETPKEPLLGTVLDSKVDLKLDSKASLFSKFNDFSDLKAEIRDNKSLNIAKAMDGQGQSDKALVVNQLVRSLGQTLVSTKVSSTDLPPIETNAVTYQTINETSAHSGIAASLGAINPINVKPSIVPATFEQALSLKGDFSPKLAMRVQWLIKQAASTAEILMDPPELGPLSVKMKSVGNETHVLFSVTNLQTKEAVEANLAKLKEMLLEQGINLGDTHVQQQEQGKSGSEQDTAALGIFDEDATELEEQAEPIKMGLLDTYI
jgi:hypothetical protein